MGRPVICAVEITPVLHDVPRTARAVGRDGEVVAALGPR